MLSTNDVNDHIVHLANNLVDSFISDNRNEMENYQESLFEALVTIIRHYGIHQTHSAQLGPMGTAIYILHDIAEARKELEEDG